MLKRRYKDVKLIKNSYFEYIDNIKFLGYAYWYAKTTLWTYSHNYQSNFIPYGELDEDIVKDIIIEDNVWIGLGVTILPSVRIGKGAVVGMNSVVTKDVPYCKIVAGNPAKTIRTRDLELYDMLKKENKFYLGRHDK